MTWLLILFADVFEIAWPFVLKTTSKYSPWAPLIGVIFALPIMFLLGESVKRLPAGTVYATFVGVGVAGTAIVGVTFFGESASLGRIASLAFIITGVIGLKVFPGAGV
jgi:quaternary ammonium compound-resistance protein SugE